MRERDALRYAAQECYASGVVRVRGRIGTMRRGAAREHSREMPRRLRLPRTRRRRAVEDARKRQHHADARCRGLCRVRAQRRDVLCRQRFTPRQIRRRCLTRVRRERVTMSLYALCRTLLTIVVATMPSSRERCRAQARVTCCAR